MVLLHILCNLLWVVVVQVAMDRLKWDHQQSAPVSTYMLVLPNYDSTKDRNWLGKLANFSWLGNSLSHVPNDLFYKDLAEELGIYGEIKDISGWSFK